MRIKNELNEVAKTAMENGVLNSLVSQCEQNRVEKTGWAHTYWKLDNFPHSEPVQINWEFIAVVFDYCVLIEGLYTFDKNYFIKIKAN